MSLCLDSTSRLEYLGSILKWNIWFKTCLLTSYRYTIMNSVCFLFIDPYISSPSSSPVPNLCCVLYVWCIVKIPNGGEGRGSAMKRQIAGSKENRYRCCLLGSISGEYQIITLIIFLVLVSYLQPSWIHIVPHNQSFWFKHILFHLHEKRLGRAQMLC